MTTAVLDIDFEHLPPLITGLERHSHALILVRLRGQPVGQVRLPVADGCIDGAIGRAMPSCDKRLSMGCSINCPFKLSMVEKSTGCE
jgi:hypothetical protein